MRVTSLMPITHMVRAGSKLSGYRSGSDKPSGYSSGSDKLSGYRSGSDEQSTPSATDPQSPPPPAAAQQSAADSFVASAAGIVVFVAVVILAVLYLIGVCTIFNRSNPTLNGAIKVLVYILLILFLGPFYIVYFVVRMGIQGIRGKADYKTLPYPAPFFKAKKGNAAGSTAQRK